MEVQKHELEQNIIALTRQNGEMQTALDKEKSAVQAFEQELRKVVDANQQQERTIDELNRKLEVIANQNQNWRVEIERLKQVQIKKDKEYKDEKTQMENKTAALKVELEQMNQKLIGARDQIQMFETD